jgi:hypothetical protein
MNLEKWEKLSFAVQMGNIGSEINRTNHWREVGDREKKESALWRALELIDLTNNLRKSKEILRLREVICDVFLEAGNYKVSIESLKNYFLQFALQRDRISLH